jgi:hypothetical protein
MSNDARPSARSAPSAFWSILAIFLVSFLALAGAMATALIAREGAVRVAVFANSAAWAEVEAAGLPVVKLALGGLLIVVDASGAPSGLERLRAGLPFLLDARLIPGCAADLPPEERS